MSTVRDVDRSSELARNGGRNSISSPELASNGGRTSISDYEPRTYRGGDLDELLPKIREELGPDALVVRQREGLQGGVAGFFQKRCVEVVARRATPRVNVYDDTPAEPAPAGEPASPAIREIMRVASPFVEQLQAAQAEQAEQAEAALGEPFAYDAGPEPEPVVEPAGRELEPLASAEVAATEPAPRTGAAAVHERALVAAGIAPAVAAEVLAATVSHGVPFGPTRALKHLVRDALAARIPAPAPVAAGRRTIAFVGAGGAGKTLCATRVADAYAAGSDLEVRRIDLTDAVPAPSAAGGHVLTVVDTPAVSPASVAGVRALARGLRRVGACEVHVAVPATLSAPAVRRLLDGLATLKPAAIVLTHLDEVDHAGPVIDAAIARGLPISFCCDAADLAPVDRAALCAQVLA